MIYTWGSYGNSMEKPVGKWGTMVSGSSNQTHSIAKQSAPMIAAKKPRQ